MYIIWYTLLVSAICLEGLGRKYLPGIPSMFFYFLKDAVLVFGYFSFPPPPSVRRAVRYLYGGFGVILVAGVVWTAIELVNPRQAVLDAGDHRLSRVLALVDRATAGRWILARREAKAPGHQRPGGDSPS